MIRDLSQGFTIYEKELSLKIQGKLSTCFSTSLVIIFTLQMTACGTLIYPERRGQKTGRIDSGVAILNGVGLLFFIVPGVIAFAVDFATGAIYLPPGQGKTNVFGERQLPLVYVDIKELNQKKIETVIAKYTGHEVSLDHPDLVITNLENRVVSLRSYQ